MRLFNTRTRTVEEFTPLRDNEARIYSCGPTVYNHAHIGNLSSYIYADILRRTIKSAGMTVKHAMNFTDVDDKTIRDSKTTYPDSQPMEALTKLTEHFEQVFLDDMQAVGNNTDEVTFIKATDNIAGIQQLIKSLLKQGIAYVADDGVYFDIAKYRQTRQYGQLSNIEFTNNNHSKQRVNNDEYDKEHAHDFALWKAQKDGEPAWGFQFDDGTAMPGRPGWHIECSVMSKIELGQPFDIHTGGIDLIFPHHENEIAQSTAGNQCELYANFFVHNEHLLVDGQKMSKSAHNFYTLPDITTRGYNALDFRMLTLQSHYRSATNFTWDNLEAAQNRLRNWRNIAELRHQVPDTPSIEQTEKLDELLSQAQAALENDLDTPNALRLFGEAFNLFTVEQTDLEALERLIDTTDQLLGLNIRQNTPGISDEQYGLIEKRQQARQNKDWQLADELRDQLSQQGIQLKDGSTVIWGRE